MPLEEGDVLGGYRIVRLLGRGGMGAVYLADDTRLGRKVALKLLAPEIAENPSIRDRFVRESRLAAALDHPHILPVYEAGEADGRLFISMRYVPGPDLGELIAAGGPLSLERSLSLVRQVASALDAAHAAGLIHRDVKPGNILVGSGAVPGTDHAYLADFGLTKHAEYSREISRPGELIGSVGYVAPEQIEGRPIDHRIDVYSLGCVLFECLVGDQPYLRDSEMATLYAHVQLPPPSLATFRPELASALDPVISEAMAKDPGDRFSTAGALARAADAAMIHPSVVGGGVVGEYPTDSSPSRWNFGWNRGRPGASRAWYVAGAGAAFFLLILLVSRGSTGLSISPSRSPSPSFVVAVSDPVASASPHPESVRPSPAALVTVAADTGDGSWRPTALNAGSYRWTKFSPQTTFTVQNEWLAGEDSVDRAELLNYGPGAYGADSPIGALEFLRAQLVLDKPCYIPEQTRFLGDKPVDFIDWVTKHPLLDAGNVRAVTVGGYPGLAVDVTVRRPPTVAECPEEAGNAPLLRRVPLFPTSAHNITLFQGDKASFASIDLGSGPPLLLVANGPAAWWDEFSTASQQLIDSLVIAGL